MSKQNGVESKVREIRRKTRARYSAEEKIRIVLEGLRGEESIAALCRREGIAAAISHGQARGKLGMAELLKLQAKSKWDRLLAPR